MTRDQRYRKLFANKHTMIAGIKEPLRNSRGQISRDNNKTYRTSFVHAIRDSGFVANTEENFTATLMTRHERMENTAIFLHFNDNTISFPRCKYVRWNKEDAVSSESIQRMARKTRKNNTAEKKARLLCKQTTVDGMYRDK